jgi:hypothetical protein
VGHVTYIVLQDVPDDQVVIIQIALYGNRTGILNSFSMIPSPNQCLDPITFAQQQLEHIPPYEARSNQEHIFCGYHYD